MGQLIKQVAASSDDAVKDSGGNYSHMATTEKLIRDASNNVQTFGFRFTSMTIPQGATINYAWLILNNQYRTSQNTIVDIYGDDQDNSPTFSSLDSPLDRTLTTANVEWDVNGDNWVANKWAWSPNIASVIKEIVDRGSWSSGNALSIILKDGGGSGTFDGHDVIMYDQAAADSAKLIIVYDESLGSGPQLRTRSLNQNQTSTSFNVQVPPSRVNGDLLLLSLISKPSGTAGSNDSFTVSGWTAVPSGTLRNEVGTNDLRIDLYYKVSDGTESSAAITSIGTAISGTEGMMGVVSVFSGVDTSSPFDITTVTSEADAAATFTPTGGTTSTANALALSIVGSSDDNNLGLDTGNERGFLRLAGGVEDDTTAGTDMSIGIAFKPIAAASTSVTCPTWRQNSNGNDQWVGAFVVLKNASAATKAPPILPRLRRSFNALIAQ